FNCDFEGGNLGTTRMIGESEYELHVRADTENPRYRLWFHFCVRNNKPKQKVVFHVVNFSKSKSLYRDGMSPTVRSQSDPAWKRIHPKHVFYYKCVLKKNQPVMTFVHVFDRPDEAYYFCYSYPFSYSHQQRLLSDLERRRLPFVTRELLCRSVQNRRCDVLMIGDQTRYKHRGVTNKRKVILLTCRVHPGETPSSHTLRGFIDWLTSDDPHAVALRLHVTFVIVPMLNPDGCFHGNYRTDSLGTDLNRAWENPTEFEPTLLAVRSLAKTYAEDSTVELDFYIDCHAHTTSKASFLFVNPPEESDSAEAWERVAALPRLVDLNCEGSALGFSLAACKFCSDPSKSGSARHALRDLLLKRGASKAMCYTLEMSFYSPPNAQKTWTATTSNEASYEAFGRAMGDSFADYYGLRS
ncbi:uncharacterized protein MICPUCDRAFT_21490, partial [Micromonas pusilla CCMP1545]